MGWLKLPETRKRISLSFYVSDSHFPWCYMTSYSGRVVGYWENASYGLESARLGRIGDAPGQNTLTSYCPLIGRRAKPEFFGIQLWRGQGTDNISTHLRAASQSVRSRRRELFRTNSKYSQIEPAPVLFQKSISVFCHIQWWQVASDLGVDCNFIGTGSSKLNISPRAGKCFWYSKQPNIGNKEGN